MHCQVLNSINPVATKMLCMPIMSLESADRTRRWPLKCFSMSESESAGIAIQPNNAKDCNFFLKKKKAGVLREIFENLLRYKNCTCSVYNIVLV